MTKYIDVQMHKSAFPATYNGDGTLVGNPTDPMAVVRRVAGYFTGPGEAVVINNGFKPHKIKVVNDTDGIIYEWQFGMDETHSIKTVLGGSLAATLDTGSAFAITKDFGDGNVCSVTLAAGVCISAKRISYLIEG